MTAWGSRRGATRFVLASCVLASALVVALTGQRREPADVDPFTYFLPSVRISDAERTRLARGEPIAHAQPGIGQEVAIFAAIRVTIGPDRLVAWVRNIEALKSSRYVTAIRRFSDPPRIADLAALQLDDADLQTIGHCRRQNCGLKLAGPEMDVLHRVIAGAGWKPQLQHAFKELILARTDAYLRGGHRALPPYEDHRGATRLHERFVILLGHTILAEKLPDFAALLSTFPNTPSNTVESFLYWSKEHLGGKPMVSATHVAILRHDDGLRPDVLIAGKGIFSTHYVTASLGITALVRGSGDANYLVYLNRTEIDALHGIFGGMIRKFMEGRLASEASELLRGLRTRLESGEPPPTTAVDRAP